jgi:hypothetical protein
MSCCCGCSIHDIDYNHYCFNLKVFWQILLIQHGTRYLCNVPIFLFNSSTLLWGIITWLHPLNSMLWRAPNSLRDSNVSPKLKTTEEQGVGARSLARSTMRGRGACWSSGMGLARIDKFYSLTWTCTKPTQSGQCVVGALLVLRRTTGNLDTQDSPRPGLGGSHHLPPYSILCAFPRGPHPNGFLSQDSHLQQLGLSRLWGRITSCADLWSRWGLKNSYSPCQEISNWMWHVACTQGNWVDSRLLMVRS